MNREESTEDILFAQILIGSKYKMNWFKFSTLLIRSRGSYLTPLLFFIVSLFIGSFLFWLISIDSKKSFGKQVRVEEEKTKMIRFYFVDIAIHRMNRMNE